MFTSIVLYDWCDQADPYFTHLHIAFIPYNFDKFLENEAFSRNGESSYMHSDGQVDLL